MALRLTCITGVTSATFSILLDAQQVHGSISKMDDFLAEASNLTPGPPDDNLTPEYGGPSSSTVALNTQLALNSTDLWGPKRDSLTVVIPITVAYAIIFLSGIIGNVSTCVVIARNRSMHTATNYYLFSLAISDLLLLVSGLPPEMYYIWFKYPYVFGESFCILQGFAAETSANATVLTITAFTVERYVAICHPFLSHTLSRLSRAVKLIVGVWTVALCFAVPQALEFGLVYERAADGGMLSEEYTACAVKRVVIPYAFEISTCLFFVAPMSLITVLYLLIGLQLHRSSMMARDGGSSVGTTETSDTNVVSTTDGCGSCSRDSRKNIAKNAQTKATKHVVKMLALPVEGPRITGGRPRYQVGDTVRVNCTSGRSKPAAQLIWFINGEQADTSFLRGPISESNREGLETSTLGLEFKVRPKHFRRGGDMKLKCLATIATVYWRSNEESVEGDRPQKAPALEIRKGQGDTASAAAASASAASGDFGTDRNGGAGTRAAVLWSHHLFLILLPATYSVFVSSTANVHHFTR